jgi:hypothetical protein
MKKGHILIFYLTLFIVYLELYVNNIKILNHKIFESVNIIKLEEYSYIESEILIEIIKMFHEYRMEDFTIESSLGRVNVYFVDEVAYIKFNFNEPVYARLDYDLVYDSCYNYDIISEALFPIVDKINS